MRTLIHTLYGTPAWLADSVEHRDLYGRPGGAAPPRDLLHLEEFVRALVTRYNGDGRRRISFIETWNEPHFDHNYEDYWWGTAAQLVALGRVLYRTAKEVDPGIRVLSPGFVGSLAGAWSPAAPALEAAEGSSLYQYLVAADGHGGVGSRWCDGIAFHCYNAPLEGPNASYVMEIARLRNLLSVMRISLPLYETEFGFTAAHGFHQLPRNEQARTLRRCAALHAGFGLKGMYFYSHDDEFVGNPSLHPEVAEAIGDVHAMIAGQRLNQVTLLANGGVEVTTAKRSFIW